MGKERVGSTIQNYVITDMIWQGSTSTVYRARALSSDAPYGREIAIKVLSSRRTEPEQIRMFRQEAALLEGLEHPNIVRMFAYFSDSEDYYLLMEYVSGKSLRQLALDKKFTFEELVRIFRDLLAALSFLEQKRIIHKDIKPENIIVSDDVSQVKLTDFGYAVRNRLFRMDKFPFAGTERYLAPERRTGKFDYRSDLYSCGKVMEELVDKTGEVLDFLPWVIAKCVEPDPDDRYSGAAEALLKLELFTSYFDAKNDLRDNY